MGGANHFPRSSMLWATTKFDHRPMGLSDDQQQHYICCWNFVQYLINKIILIYLPLHELYYRLQS